MTETPPDGAAPPAQEAYQVLARKYRPGHFRDLIGQEAMVQTLTNAFAHDRIAHAFVLTGVRGVGKTTTARIIATGLNCTGRGDKPTVDPCGECSSCMAIGAGRHVDVLEMDAASNTGVDDVREIIESVRYRAVEARYKVYIVDEVHMLSTSAFNALLKTLEEPPEHVVFLFATTEIRKVPVTVLSRCQRFDLRRIEPEVMLAHLAGIAAKEGARIGEDALGLIVRAAEGSVRDALSLLDQALAHGAAGEGEIDAAAVRAMLGLADRGRLFDLFETIMAGDAAGALAELGRQYADGADPAVVLRDLAELTHWLSVVRISAELGDDPTVSPEERDRGRELAGRLSMRTLTRTWQMLLKAMEELARAPSAIMAAEMTIIRLTHVAELPSPEELIRRLEAEEPEPPAPAGGGGGRAPGAGEGTARGMGASGGSNGSAPTGSAATGGAPRAEGPGPARAETRLSVVMGGAGRGGGHGVGGQARQMDVEVEPAPAPASPPAAPVFADLAAMAEALEDAREYLLANEVSTFLRLVALRDGVVETALTPGAPADLPGRLSEMLGQVTGRRWSVVLSAEDGQPTLREAAARENAEAAEAAAQHPLVLAALETFPGARIVGVRPLRAPSPAEMAGAAEEAAHDWVEDPDAALLDDEDDDITTDPFEER
ncbi:MAG: DNA polymerase III subunit gamma/tau [Pseudomonadota bacterium]